MRKRIFFGLLCLGVQLCSIATAQVYDLPRSTPEEQGVPSKALITVFDSLMATPQTDIHSVVVMRHGKVIGEIYPKPFAIEYKHTMYSCSKTFVSMAVGLAIEENRLRLTDRVAPFFIESLPDSISKGLAEMTVEDLLTMRSGITPDWEMRNICTDWIRTFLAKPVEGAGEKFGYDSMATYMLSAIVQKVTGMTTLDYLKKKIFKDMHITDVAWELSPEGVNTGGWGLYIQSESLAKFGQLWLDKGKWNGKQLVPASWIEQMNTLHVKSNSYGYQIWHCAYPGAVRADGAFGQWVIVVPDKDMVVVITQCSTGSGRYQRGLIWNHIVPQLSDTPLAVGNDYKRLKQKQSTYQLAMPEGKAGNMATSSLLGKKVLLKKNIYGWTTIDFKQQDKAIVMKVTTKKGEVFEIPFGYKKWETGQLATYPFYSINALGRFSGIEGPFFVAGSYACPEKNMLKMKAHYVNWITPIDYTWKVEGHKVYLGVVTNHGSKTAKLEGVIQD